MLCVFVMTVIVISSIIIAEIVNKIIMFFVNDKQKSNILVVNIDDCEDLELKLRGIIARAKWQNKQKTRIICVNNGKNSENKKICDLLKKDYPLIEIV